MSKQEMKEFVRSAGYEKTGEMEDIEGYPDYHGIWTVRIDSKSIRIEANSPWEAMARALESYPEDVDFEIEGCRIF